MQKTNEITREIVQKFHNSIESVYSFGDSIQIELSTMENDINDILDFMNFYKHLIIESNIFRHEFIEDIIVNGQFLLKVNTLNNLN